MNNTDVHMIINIRILNRAIDNGREENVFIRIFERNIGW